MTLMKRLERALHMRQRDGTLRYVVDDDDESRDHAEQLRDMRDRNGEGVAEMEDTLDARYPPWNSMSSRSRSRSRPAPADVTSNAKADFSSNDYLGLSRCTKIHDMFLSRLLVQASVDDQTESPHDQHVSPDVRMGATGSRLLSGNSKQAMDLERKLAEFHMAESALIFNSGYDANLGLFSSLPQQGSSVIFDELIHASVQLSV
jgi:7-keto-8-aminopelargonate synthetase-like enzyme